MRRIFRLRKRSLLVCSMLLYAACANAQQEFLCTQINQPATAAFDFTDDLTRWGNTNMYNIDDAPHRVRSITINTLPIFDESNPAENRLLYRWANAIHYVTKPQVIAEQVLFTANMPVNSRLLAESERILRGRKYVGDAKIRVLQDCDNTVDLEVVTREVWTLSPDITYKAAGGHSTTGIGVSDSNILGSGQSLAFKVKKDQERNSALLAFKNPNIRGSRIEINAEYAKNSDVIIIICKRVCRSMLWKIGAPGISIMNPPARCLPSISLVNRFPSCSTTLATLISNMDFPLVDKAPA